jgi:antitoxin component YwqK of YwqJK toxin-antitoxin module
MKDYALTEEGHYINDEKDGKWVDYLPGGIMPAVITNYKDGKLDGLMTQFGRRGEKVSEAVYKNGVKEGKFRMFDANGKIIIEKNYAKGQELRP